jgi:RNA polymerase sigma-70 factor (ECF subfamily)
MEPSDAQLLYQWRQGNREAGKALFARYYDTLERFFVNKVQNGIGDLVQETFRMCLEARDRIEDAGKFRSYLFSIAYNVLRGHYRKRARHGIEIDLDETCVQELAPGPCSVLVEREQQRLLLEALRSIPLNDQLILELQYWESLKVGDIAEILGVPDGTVKGRLYRARERLEEAMRVLAASAEILTSTLSDLDDWARQCRRQLGRSSTMSA